MTNRARKRAREILDQAIADGWLIRFIDEDGSRSVIERDKATPEQIAVAVPPLREGAGRKTRGRRWLAKIRHSATRSASK